MKKLVILLLALVAAGAGGWAYVLRRGNPDPVVTTQPFSRGDVIESVGATGTLGAVETVDVGTQVSGVVKELYADFNSIVKKGQVIAKLDPQLIETQIEQQIANVARAEADLERLRVTLADAKQKLERAQQMSAKQLIPHTDLETAEVNLKSAEAQIRSSEAALTQAKAQLNNQKVNLGYTTITAPIDGIIISRNVDQGQTVAASMNAPTLYVIAADLTKMQVIANIDEADVGRMRPNQNVTFHVDAYPTDTFRGTVSQVRLQPTVVQNVVTYSTVIRVPNPDLRLKPGMTANVSIEIARRDNVLRVANRALSFRPTNEMFQVLNQPVPPELERGRGGFGGRRGEGQRAGNAPGGAPDAPAPGGQPSSQPGAAPQQQPGTRPQSVQANAQPGGQREPRANSPEARGGGSTGSPQAGAGRGPGVDPQANAGGGRGQGVGGGFGQGQGRGGFDPNMTDEERQRRREERMKNMTPEERAAFEARMREARGGRGGFPGGGFGGREGGGFGSTPGGGRGGDPAAQGGGSNRGAGSNPALNPRSAPVAPDSLQSRTMASGATTIDALFAPIHVQERPGTAWLYQNKQLKALRLRLGVSDGTYTEVVNESDVPPNTEVVVNLVTGLEPRTTPGQTNQNNPLMGPQRGGPGRGGPGGGPGGGGRGRG